MNGMNNPKSTVLHEKADFLNAIFCSTVLGWPGSVLVTVYLGLELPTMRCRFRINKRLQLFTAEEP